MSDNLTLVNRSKIKWNLAVSTEFLLQYINKMNLSLKNEPPFCLHFLMNHYISQQSDPDHQPTEDNNTSTESNNGGTLTGHITDRRNQNKRKITGSKTKHSHHR